MVVHLREGSIPHVKDRKCDQDAWIVSSSEVVVFFSGMLNKEFHFVLTQFKKTTALYITSIHEYYMDAASLTLVHLPLGL